MSGKILIWFCAWQWMHRFSGRGTEQTTVDGRERYSFKYGSDFCLSTESVTEKLAWILQLAGKAFHNLGKARIDIGFHEISGIDFTRIQIRGAPVSWGRHSITFH